MHLDEVRVVVRYDIEPVVNHTVSAGAIPLQVLDVRGRVDILQPLRYPEQHRSARAGEVDNRDPDVGVVPDHLQCPPRRARARDDSSEIIIGGLKTTRHQNPL